MASVTTLATPPWVSARRCHAKFCRRETRSMSESIVRKRFFTTASFVSALLLSSSSWALTSFTATYSGKGSGSGCASTFNISGQEPDAVGTYPVFVYAVGTSENFQNGAATAAVAGMANRGYVAATVQYSNGSFGNCSAISAKAQCMFNPSSAGSAITRLCSRAKADCSKGIVVGGFSQGSIIADLAKNFDARVQAAWGMGDWTTYIIFNLSSCVANGSRALASDHLRIVNGGSDVFGGSSSRTQLQNITGVSCGSSGVNCLQANGSGWYLVQNNQVGDGSADHCYMRASG